MTRIQSKCFAVLVNEFGELGIDGELLKSCQICPEDGEGDTNIFELNNGCLCCTVQEEFYPTMQELIKRRATPTFSARRIYIIRILSRSRRQLR